MKNNLLFWCLLCSGMLFSQKKVAEKVQQLVAQKTPFVAVTPLVLAADQDLSTAAAAVTTATKLTLNKAVLTEVMSQKPTYIRVQIPYEQQTLSLLLFQVNPFSEGFHVDTDRQKNIPFERGVYYRGTIEGSTTAVATFNFFSNECNGIVADLGLGNIIIGKPLAPTNANDYLIYNDKNLKGQAPFQCHFKDEAFQKQIAKPQLHRETTTENCVTFYFEIDYNLYEANGSDTTTTTNWMTSLYNNVQTIFTNDGITTALRSIFIWTSPDVYEASGFSSFDYLAAFQQNRPSFDGDVGQLLGIDPGGLGGVAYLNSTCEQYNYAYSDLDGLFFETVPTYSWAVQVITHEFGHSLGSPHTHGCYWNNDDTALDGCGQQAGFYEPFEGACPEAPIPFETGGSIMSYCHLTSGVGVNLALGFSPQPAQLIQETINSKNCLSSDCINTCINTAAAITVATVTTTSATITWEDPTGLTTTWEVSLTPLNTEPSWVVVNNNSYSVSNLLPNSYYRFSVRPICETLVPAIESIVFATNGLYCNGLLFTDTGGLNNEYSNNEAFVRVIAPNTPNQKIRAIFTEFDLETDWDFLYIYDGNSTAATSLNPDGYTGTNSPGTIEATTPDGALTFRFFSDGWVTAPGWTAQIGCVQSLNVDQNAFTDFSYFPNPTQGKVTLKANVPITQISIFNVEGRKLGEYKGGSLETTIDISQYATGTYFLRATTGDLEHRFKIVKY